MAFTLCYVTHPDEATAVRIGQALLQQKWIACYNLLPIQSAYWWQGSIETATEVVTLLKTSSRLADSLEAVISKLHPYTTPCIMRIEVTANAAYEAWIEHSVRTQE